MHFVSVDEIISKMGEEITEKQKQIELIKNTDWTKAPTEEEWHKLCETPIRNTDKLCLLAKNIFPNATEITWRPNFIYFNLYGFRCAIPTFELSGIHVDFDWYRKYGEMVLLEEYFSINEQIMLKYFELVDRKAGWYELITTRVPKTKNFSKFRAFFMWFLHYKWKNTHREEWKKSFEETRQSYLEKVETRENEIREIQKKCEKFEQKCLPELILFSKKIRSLNDWNPHASDYAKRIRDMVKETNTNE